MASVTVTEVCARCDQEITPYNSTVISSTHQRTIRCCQRCLRAADIRAADREPEQFDKLGLPPAPPPQRKVDKLSSLAACAVPTAAFASLALNERKW